MCISPVPSGIFFLYRVDSIGVGERGVPFVSVCVFCACCCNCLLCLSRWGFLQLLPPLGFDQTVAMFTFGFLWSHLTLHDDIDTLLHHFQLEAAHI